MKISYCDVNNQFARYLHKINHPLVKEYPVFKADEKTTTYYYWRTIEREITWSKQYIDGKQVSLGEFIGNIVSLRDNPELIIPIILFGTSVCESDLECKTVYSLNGTSYWHLQLLKCFKPILDNFDHKEITVCTSPNDNSTVFIIKYDNAIINLNAWKNIDNIYKQATFAFNVGQDTFLSTVAFLFKDKQLVYNLLTNLCGYFKVELLNEKELSSLIKYFKDYYGNTNQLQEQNINLPIGSSTGEHRSYGQGSKITVRFGHLSNRARVVASTKKCSIIATEISTKCSRNSWCRCKCRISWNGFEKT